MEKETAQIIVILFIMLWTLPWKGVALWKAATSKHRVWFVIMLVINTLAILEILYIFVFSKKKPLENIKPSAIQTPNKKIV